MAEHVLPLSPVGDSVLNDQTEVENDLLSRSIQIDGIDEKYMEVVILWCRQADKTVRSFNKDAAVKQLIIVFACTRDADDFRNAEVFSLGFSCYRITKPSPVDIHSHRAESSESRLSLNIVVTTAKEYREQRPVQLTNESDETHDNKESAQQADREEPDRQEDNYCELCRQRISDKSSEKEDDDKLVQKIEDAETSSRVNQCTINDTVAYKNLVFLDKEPIGFGGFGAVFHALHIDWGCQVAYKRLSVNYIGQINKADERLIQKLKYEAEIHRQLRHPNIVSMLGVVFEANNYGIILEYVTYGSWTNFLNHMKEVADYSIATILKAKLAFEISSGMSYLHSLKIIHCDLKVQNVLIGEDINAKISDFGLSKWKNYSRSNTSAGFISGTPSHIPPEQWKNDSFRPNDKSDVYSFAILLWEMFTEKHAFEDRQGMICDLVMSGKRLPLDCLPEDIPLEVHAMIKACWSQNPDKRPNFIELTITLRSMLDLPLNKQQLNEAKTKVFSAYYRRSVPVDDVEHEHSQKINRVRQTLREFIRRLDQILQELFVKRAITLGEHETILSQAAIFQKATNLLDVLILKPASTYEHFLEALDLTDQHHLHCLLEEKDFIMNVDHHTKLLDNFTYLKQNIILSDSTLLDNLLMERVLDSQEVEDIRSKRTEHERINQLLHLIMRTSQEQYQLFLESLDRSEHQHVYIHLTAEHRHEEAFSTKAFVDKPALVYVLETLGSILAITLFGSSLVVVQHIRSTTKREVCVYNTSTMRFSHKIKIQDSEYPDRIIACPHDNCLYITDERKEIIYRYDVGLGKVIKSWSMGGSCLGLFVTKRSSVLATLYDKLNEYTPDGDLIRSIVISESIKGLRHSVQLSNEQIVVSYSDYKTGNRGVCIVDDNGRIVQTYKEKECEERGLLRMIAPCHMVVDERDNLIVAEMDGCFGAEISLLSPSLDHLGYIKIPENKKRSFPNALNFDGINRHLYIGDHWGRVSVLGADVNENNFEISKQPEVNKQDSCTVS